MGFLPGGTADKLGNRYEVRWVVKQLLYLIAERILSVQIEAIGDDEIGVDLWVERLDGVRVAYQCKAFNKSQNKWSISDLKHREVLDKAQTQLIHDRYAQFIFVSTIAAPELEDLSRVARDFSGDPDTFFEFCVRQTPREKQFNLFCRAMGKDATSLDDRLDAFDFLRRIACHAFADDQSTIEELSFQASYLLEGQSPRSAVAALAEIAVDNLHQTLTSPKLLQLLEGYDLRPAASSGLHSASRLDELRRDFVDSIKPHLAGGELIGRPETQEICRLLQTEDGQDAIILHGAPGFGKSGVLYELANDLKQQGVTLFAIRLDRQTPNTNSSAAYGRELGLTKSPVACLRDLAAGQRVVLILDQLDALRWTNAHSPTGLAVCKQMLREVQAARSLGANIDLIIACRTFDLERDPEIRAWLNNDKMFLKLAKIEAQPLTLPVIRRVIQRHTGIDPDSLKAGQLKLLESVHHLAIWLEIVRTERASPNFESATQLLRTYWCNRRQKLEQTGCDAAARDQTIEALVHHMEENAVPSAPERLIKSEKLKTELQSLGVITVLSGEVTFGHQSNLDFLVADAAVAKMTTNNQTVLDWLGPADRHSLFRREQLRQVLFLLADEAPSRFLDTVQALLAAPNVRFHLRQLALEAVGQVLPKPDTIEMVLRLLESPQWTQHIRYYVVHGNKEYVKAIYDKGLIAKSLITADTAIWNPAADWIYSVRQTLPDLLLAACEYVIANSSDWVSRVSWMIGRDGEEIEPEAIFALRLKCLSQGGEPIYVDWDKFSKKTPDRAMRLFAALIDGWIVRGAKWDRYRDESHIYGKDCTPLVAAAQKYPRKTWKRLWPLLSWFITEQRARRQLWLKANPGRRYGSPRERIVVPRTLRKALLISLSRICQLDPDRVLQLARDVVILKSRFLTSFFVEALAFLPATRADAAVEWLMIDTHRLHSGDNKKRVRWATAAALIRKMSPHCSMQNFEKLQQYLLNFRDPEEKRLAAYWLSDTRAGFFANRFGAAQWCLLPALCAERRSREVTGRIGVLVEKFGPASERHFAIDSGARGGVVISPIDRDGRYARMSDAAWLKLITNDRLPDRRARWRTPPGQRRDFLASSVEMMSRSLRRAANLNPERFAQMAIQLPRSVNAQFLVAILDALRGSTAPDELSEDERSAWSPASAVSINLLLETIPLRDGAEFVKAVCWLFVRRDDLTLTKRTLDYLRQAVRHMDPLPNQLHVYCDQTASDCSIEALMVNSINCVRGVAANAISSILTRQLDLLPEFEEAINILITDEHPAVRMAAVELCAPIWNSHEQQAVAWLVRLALSDDRIAASDEARRLYNYAFPKYRQDLTPAIQGMLASSSKEVVKAGAAQIAARWALFNLFESEFTRCVTGSVAEREGVAAAFAHLVIDSDCTHKCLPYLQLFMDDEDLSIRNCVNGILNRDEILELPWIPEFILKLTRSKIGRDDDRRLLWKLKELAELDIFAESIFAISTVTCDYFIHPDTFEKNRYPDVDTLVGLLLRLYGQCRGTGRDVIRQRCLDAWDMLLQSRATVAWSFTRGLDATQF